MISCYVMPNLCKRRSHICFSFSVCVQSKVLRMPSSCFFSLLSLRTILNYEKKGILNIFLTYPPISPGVCVCVCVCVGVVSLLLLIKEL